MLAENVRVPAATTVEFISHRISEQNAMVLLRDLKRIIYLSLL